MADTNITNTVTGKLALIQMGLTRPQDVKDMAYCRATIDSFTKAVRTERTVRAQVAAGTATQSDLDTAVNAVTYNLNLMDGHN